MLQPRLVFVSALVLASSACLDDPWVATEGAAARTACAAGIGFDGRTLAISDLPHLERTYQCLADGGDDAIAAFEASFAGFRSRRVAVGGGDPVLQAMLDAGGRVDLGAERWRFEISRPADPVREVRAEATVNARVTLIQSNFGDVGNFEVVAARDDFDGGLQHFYRTNDNALHPWTVGPVFSMGYHYQAVSLIQSGAFGAQGNFELVAALPGLGLEHFFRDNDDPAAFAWHSTDVFGDDSYRGVSLVETGSGAFCAVGARTNGGLQLFCRPNVSGPGSWASVGPPFAESISYESVSMIESEAGALELVATQQGGGLEHFTKAGWAPFVHVQTFGSEHYNDVALIQSSYGSVGNFEVVATRDDGGVQPWFRDNDLSSGWQAGPGFGAGAFGIALIQSNFGVEGNFEVVTTRPAGGIRHHYRDNDAPPANPWHQTTP